MSINVLLVDDSRSMRSVIRKTVQISGIDVGEFYEASTGTEALDMLRDNWVDLILSDVHMPEMNGLELLRTLKEDDILKSIPVVMITTEGRDDRVNEAFRVGAAGYLKKPFTPEQIKEKLMEILGEQNVRAPAGDLEGCDF